jgi:hypothetical protein
MPHERKEIENIPMKKGDVLVFDRGYTDYKFYASLCRKDIYFVSRLKKNADFEVLMNKDVSKYMNIGYDQQIILSGYYSEKNARINLESLKAMILKRIKKLHF